MDFESQQFSAFNLLCTFFFDRNKTNEIRLWNIHIFGDYLLNQWNRYFCHLWFGDLIFQNGNLQVFINSKYSRYYKAERVTFTWVKFMCCLTHFVRKRRLSAWIGCARTKKSTEMKFIEHMFDTINIHGISELPTLHNQTNK